MHTIARVGYNATKGETQIAILGGIDMAHTPKQLGHLVIKVRDIERSVDFYTNVLGLTVMTGRPGGMTFLSAGHHDVP